jgi:hypothetical protein
MTHRSSRLLEIARWLAIGLGLLALAAFRLFGEDTIDRALQPICPAGWWHTSAFWAHCAYPPISIAKYAGLHVGACVVALALVGLLAPRGRRAACVGLLILFLAAPAVWLLWHGFSWTAWVALGGVAVVMLVFALGVCAERLDATSAWSTSNG